ncbi:MAG: NAD-dependent epimerase/dehydratase family protein [Actinobacteria bacterium]|nr:NAD-dependent epimerase/dehydratase family protein [Actinomycetota bacterium]
MKALVTGVSGFIGGNIARVLIESGHAVRALVRESSKTSHLNGLPIDYVLGDLRDIESLRKSLRGCDVLFHVAAYYAFWCEDPKLAYDSNVIGTQNILTAALEQGVERVVYTSSESTIKIRDGELGNEEMLVDPSEVAGDYKKSKVLAERVVLGLYDSGLPVVIVNPTTPVGRGDVKPTPTGQFILDFLNNRMPAYVDTGLNLIDVEDVAVGHLLAYEKGVPGERYILGNTNLTFKGILEILGNITGKKPPEIRIPIGFAMAIAYVDEFISGKLMKRCPRVPVAAVKTSKKIRHFDCSRAVKELGLPQTPVEKALRKAVVWFKENGYVKC